MKPQELRKTLVDAGVLKSKNTNAGRGKNNYRGVSWDPSHNKWKVRISQVHIGRFDDEEEARVVAEKARKLFDVK